MHLKHGTPPWFRAQPGLASSLDCAEIPASGDGLHWQQCRYHATCASFVSSITLDTQQPLPEPGFPELIAAAQQCLIARCA